MTDPTHLERLRAAMAAAGVDALLLGYEDDVRWVTGARRLWLDGTRPFVPVCVVGRAAGAVHLLATSDAGLPAPLGAAQVFGPTWDPVTAAARVAAVPGLTAARTIGTVGTDPGTEELLAGFLPRATFVDGGPVVRTARRTPTPTDRAAVAAAVDATRRALAAVVATIAAGVSERDLAAAFLGRLGELGVTTLGVAPTTCVAHTPPRAFPDDRRLAAGDLVHLRGAVLVDGHLGLVARTRAVGPLAPAQRAAAEAARAALHLVTGAARPGQVVGALRARPEVQAVHGVGAGQTDLGDDESVTVDDVLWVEVLVDEVLLGDVVHVGTETTAPLVPTPYGLG